MTYFWAIFHYSVSVLKLYLSYYFRVIVSLNVNHTVDSSEPDDGSQEAPEMKSMPNFEVDIVKSNGKTLSFSCQYIGIYFFLKLRYGTRVGSL